MRGLEIAGVLRTWGWGLGLLALTACQSGPRVALPAEVRKYEIPCVAVLDFENKAPTVSNWNLSRGMRDLLEDELVQSGRYTVLTRRQIDAVIGEQERQRDPHFRAQGRVPQGQLKNAQYLLRGSVTDFSHRSGGSLWAWFSRVFFSGSGETAIVAVTLQVIEVETGEVRDSIHLEGTASAGSASFAAGYKNVSFGGDSFYRTPLGRATKEVMGRAVAHLAETVARTPWQPRVAKVEGQRVYLSGGQDRALRAGSRWEAWEPGEPILDPATGDLLGYQRETMTATLRLEEIQERLSVATLEQGAVSVGERLRPAGSGKP